MIIQIAKISAQKTGKGPVLTVNVEGVLKPNDIEEMYRSHMVKPLVSTLWTRTEEDEFVRRNLLSAKIPCAPVCNMLHLHPVPLKKHDDEGNCIERDEAHENAEDCDIDVKWNDLSIEPSDTDASGYAFKMSGKTGNLVAVFPILNDYMAFDIELEPTWSDSQTEMDFGEQDKGDEKTLTELTVNQIKRDMKKAATKLRKNSKKRGSKGSDSASETPKSGDDDDRAGVFN